MMKSVIKDYFLSAIANRVSMLTKDLEIKEVRKNSHFAEYNIRPKIKEINPGHFCIMSPQNKTILDVKTLLKNEKTPVPFGLSKLIQNMNIQIEFTDSFKRHGVSVKFMSNDAGLLKTKQNKPALIE